MYGSADHFETRFLKTDKNITILYWHIVPNIIVSNRWNRNNISWAHKLPHKKKYDALRAYYLDDMPAREVSAKFGYTSAYFKKIRSEFRQALKREQNPFFLPQKPGPKERNTSQTTIKLIVALRKKNYSIQDIRMALSAQNISIGRWCLGQ